MDKRKKGNIGEDIAVKFLKDKGFIITDRNYLKKWGELDIVAKRQGLIHFFEVKSVMADFSGHNPEDNVHNLKIRHLRKIIETYLQEKTGRIDREFKFHILCVFVDMENRKGRVKWLQDIIL